MFENVKHIIPGQLAAADLSAANGKLVKITSSGVNLCSAAGEVAHGVLVNNPVSGAAACVAVAGEVECIAGTGGVTKGDLITTNASGKGVTATKDYTVTNDASSATDALVGSHVIGVALSTAAADGYFTLEILHIGAVATTAV